MKVLHVIGGVSWRYGGTTATILPMCDALAQLPGVSVTIAATDADGPGRHLTDESRPRTLAELKLFRMNWSDRWKFSAGLARWLNAHSRDYDVVHSHGVWGFSNAAAGWAARRVGVPLVVSPHGMLSPYSRGRGRLMKGAYWRLIERPVLRRAACLHLTSQGEATEVAELDLATRRTIIPLGLPDEAWDRPADPDWLRAQLDGHDRGRPLVLFLSRLHPKKGLADLMLPAFARLRGEAFLVVAGGADDTAPGYEGQVRAAIDTLGLGDRVHLLGSVTAEDRWKAFDGVAVFVLPSYQENFGLVVTEAMARGTPVVVSDRAFSCEHLAAADAGRVVPLAVESVAAGVEDILGDPTAARAMGERGRAYARRHLAWGDIAKSVREMYQSCL